MRCTNCGWENSEERINCEKCNSPLSTNNRKEYSMTDIYARRTVNENMASNIGMATVRYDVKNNTCTACGYPVLSNQEECPNCGHTVEAEDRKNNLQTCPKCNHTNQKEAIYCSHCGFELQKKEKLQKDYGRKTITPWEIQQPATSCTLTMIPNVNENIQTQALSFSGDEIILNRANTESGNMTITSKEQAVLIYEDKKWYIEDRSEHKTTFIHIAERVELKSGDMIVLGNRRFEFGE